MTVSCHEGPREQTNAEEMNVQRSSNRELWGTQGLRRRATPTKGGGGGGGGGHTTGPMMAQMELPRRHLCVSWTSCPPPPPFP